MAEHATNRNNDIAAIGNILGPLFLKDPGASSDLAPLLQKIAQQTPDDLAEAWPFTQKDIARSAFTHMQKSIPHGMPTNSMIWDYRRLFVGPEAMPCPPWGSVYTDHEEVVFGESELALTQWLTAHRIDVKDDNREPVDHIGRMFELLAYLSQNRPELVDEFLQNHFLTWASHYLDQLKDAANDPFYQGLATLSKSTLDGIQSSRHIEVTYPRFYR